MKKTMYEKIWDSHLVHEPAGEASILYIDRHLLHEVTSPQAFEGLRNESRPVRRIAANLATLATVCRLKIVIYPLLIRLRVNRLKP